MDRPAIDDFDVVLPPDFDELVERAETGHPFDWGRLYGMAGAFMRAGLPLPEPLSGIIGERMIALGTGLTQRPIEDVRGTLVDLVTPTSRVRLYGPKTASKARKAALCVLDLIGTEPRHGRRKQVVARVAQLTGLTPHTIDREIAKVRAEANDKSPG